MDDHAIPCANSGMDACDELHSASSQPATPLAVRIFALADGKYGFAFMPKPVLQSRDERGERGTQTKRGN